MARLEEKDPRWIVEEREDGKNVNNWHWVESDLTKWTTEKMEEHLGKIKVGNDQVNFEVKSVTMSGDVIVQTRKQKMMIIYDLEVKLKIEGRLKKDEVDDYKGEVVMPYISQENDFDDFEVEVRITEGGPKKDDMKHAVRKEIIPILKKQIPIVLQQLTDYATQKTNLQLKKQLGGSTKISDLNSSSDTINKEETKKDEPTKKDETKKDETKKEKPKKEKKEKKEEVKKDDGLIEEKKKRT